MTEYNHYIDIRDRNYASPYLRDYAIIQHNFKVWCDGEEPDPAEYEKYTDTLMMLLFKHQEYKRTNKTENDERRLTEFMFITISPPNTVSLAESLKCFKKFITKTNFKEYLYVIEQRGENYETVGTGIHYHFLVRHTYSKFSDLSRETKNTFKNIIDTSNPNINNIINFKTCETKTDVNKRIEYMTGIKKDECKHLKQEMDKLFRQQNNLHSYYGTLRNIEITPNITN